MIKKTYYLFFLLIFAFACTLKKNSHNLEAKEIEVYYDNNWTATSTTNISQNREFRFAICDIEDSYQKIRYFHDTLNYQDLDSINKYLRLIRTEIIDSTYFDQCNDCGFVIVTINYSDTTINTQINGLASFNNNISKLSRYILDKQPKNESAIDSIYDFLLIKHIRVIPPPPGLE